MKKKLFFLLLNLFFSFKVQSKADWTFLIYMEAEGQLAHWALNNITDILAAKPNDSVNIFIQCHMVGDNVFRYSVNENALLLEEVIKVGSDIQNDLVESSKWAFKNSNSKYNGIILWNHGFGILDPKYVENGFGEFPFEPEQDLNDLVCCDGTCPLKFSYLEDIQHLNHKGILFKESQKNYLNNQQMIQAFKTIKKDVLQNKKLDILGTDCCKMAMLEVGYQIKEFVDYLIGSQNCELLDGWNYKGFFENFGVNLTPEQVCNQIVTSYGKYYKENTKEDIYTLSAISLKDIDLLVNNINNFSDYYLELLEKDFNYFDKFIKNARLKSLAICQATFYTDIDSFYTELLIELEDKEKYKLELGCLKDILNDGKKIIQDIVIANVTGENKKEAKGISIYFPNDHIDSSYVKTVFAKDCNWISFIEKFVG
jgi:hypothetical protein